MGTEACLALTGRRCIPQRLRDAGFQFNHCDLGECLHGIFAEDRNPKLAPANETPCKTKV
jgi:NAD dependent epimerase/dehydratase family enzyme